MEGRREKRKGGREGKRSQNQPDGYNGNGQTGGGGGGAVATIAGAATTAGGRSAVAAMERAREKGRAEGVSRLVGRVGRARELAEEEEVEGMK